MIKSGIFDKNGKEVKIGDTLILPYVDPMGGLHEDISNEEVIVQFKHGCFGYETVIDFIPLMNWSKKKTGEYVCNRGNKIIILDKYVFQIKRE